MEITSTKVESSSESSSQSSDEEVNERLIENKPETGRGESKTTTDSKQTKVSVDDQSETESDSDSESGIETKQKQSKTNSSSNCDDPQSSMESSSEEEDEIVNEHINKGKDGKGKSETSHSKQTNDSDDDQSETESESESGMDEKQKQSTINLSSNCNDPQSSSESSSDEEGQKDEHVNKIKVRREDSEKESEESQSETESDEDQMEKVSEKSQFEKVTSDEESVELAPKSGSRNISSISQNSNNFESFVTEKKKKKGRKEIELSTSKKHQQTVATREKDQLYLSSWRQAKGKSDTKIQCYSASARKLVTENVKVVKIVAIGGDEIKDFRNTDLDQMPMTSAVWASHNQFQTSEFIINLDREYKGGVLLSMDEARENIDFLIRKGESLGGHPFHLSTTVKTAFTFAFQDTVQAALKEKGFMFRNGNFTTREDKLISENFELFLSKHHICSKSEKVQEILFSNISTEFQRQTGILVFVAHRLPRSSYQIYYRLRHLYHKGNYKGAFTASESQRVLELVKSGKTIETGHNGQYKEVGDEIGRYRNSVRTKYNSIKKAKGDILDIGQKDFGTLVRVIQKITDEMDLSTVKEIAWNDVA